MRCAWNLHFHQQQHHPVQVNCFTHLHQHLLTPAPIVWVYSAVKWRIVTSCFPSPSASIPSTEYWIYEPAPPAQPATSPQQCVCTLLEVVDEGQEVLDVLVHRLEQRVEALQLSLVALLEVLMDGTPRYNTAVQCSAVLDLTRGVRRCCGWSHPKFPAA